MFYNIVSNEVRFEIIKIDYIGRTVRSTLSTFNSLHVLYNNPACLNTYVCVRIQLRLNNFFAQISVVPFCEKLRRFIKDSSLIKSDFPSLSRDTHILAEC